MGITTLYVFAGGGIGAVLRYLISILATNFLKGAHWGTLLVNVVGAALIYILNSKGVIQTKNIDAGIKIGLLGGLTTFSTFSYEVFKLLEEGKLAMGMTYFGLNIILGIVVMVIIFR